MLRSQRILNAERSKIHAPFGTGGVVQRLRELLLEAEAHKAMLVTYADRLREEKSQLSNSSVEFAVLDYLEFSYIKLGNRISEGLTTLQPSGSSANGTSQSSRSIA